MLPLESSKYPQRMIRPAAAGLFMQTLVSGWMGTSEEAAGQASDVA